MIKGFYGITSTNGFDRRNLDNGRQNNYAWSMAELGDYLYVGTGRNIVYSVLKSGALGNIEIPEEFVPKNVDMSGEIWRYKKNGRYCWERVYKASEDLRITGFRFMIKFTTPSGETGLYAGAYSSTNKITILKFTEKDGWRVLDTGIILGNSTRSMIVQNGKLYMSVINDAVGTGEEGALIYESSDPEKEGWKLVTGPGDKEKNPPDGVVIMEVFNGHVYAGVASADGFQVWRTNGTVPKQDDWKLVIDKGAGDALNEIPLSMGVFKNHLYVGSAITFGVLSVDPNVGFVFPKGFDLVRIDKNDKWELVVGGKARKGTNPTTGIRKRAISGISSGFGHISNGYCWQIQEYNGELYVGTWDWSVLIPPLYRVIKESGNSDIFDMIDNEFIRYALQSPYFVQLLIRLIRPLFGFDLYKTKDGVHWEAVTINGFENGENYGVRKLFKSENGDLYVGTANPFEGCEVWVKRKPYGGYHCC